MDNLKSFEKQNLAENGRWNEPAPKPRQHITKTVIVLSLVLLAGLAGSAYFILIKPPRPEVNTLQKTKPKPQTKGSTQQQTNQQKIVSAESSINALLTKGKIVFPESKENTNINILSGDLPKEIQAFMLPNPVNLKLRKELYINGKVGYNGQYDVKLEQTKNLEQELQNKIEEFKNKNIFNRVILNDNTDGKYINIDLETDTYFIKSLFILNIQTGEINHTFRSIKK